MICIPIMAKTMEEALDLMLDIPPEADCIEIRLDTLDAPEVPELIAAAPCPVIITCRPVREGGHYNGGENGRIGLLRTAIEEGAEYVDIEADSIHEIPPGGSSKRIASFHDFDNVPDDLAARVKEMESLPCDIVKFAVMPHSVEEAMLVLHVMQDCAKPVIGIAMGEYGEFTRILGSAWGSFLTFASLGSGTETAPGQVSVEELVNLYRHKEITRETPIYAVVGDPIAHSVSPEIHNTALAECGLPGVYLRFRVENFPSFLRHVAEPLGIRGLSVTLPHKTAALTASTIVEAPAGDIGAVNTLTRIDSGWHGCNTDCEAALSAIRQAAQRAGFELPGETAVVLGAGGAARALAYGLREAGCNVVIANRTRSKAEALAAEMGARVADLSGLDSTDYRVIANSTTVGMHPDTDATPLPDFLYRPDTVVFDAVYNPRETRVLREAKSAGAEIADGVEMFVGQAAAQFTRWTGVEAPRAAMERIVLQRLSCNH